MEKEGGKYSNLENVIIALDVALAFMLFFFSANIISTTFGKASIIFGYIMLTLVTIFRILQKW